MFKALLYKEWIKTRRIVFLLSIILFALITYTFINTGQIFRVGGAVQTWTNIILKDMPILPEILKWFPLLTGILIGLVQFIPEMTDKRFKLTLHLPMSESKILSSMLAYGIICIVALFILLYASLFIGFRIYYPLEIIMSMTWQILPYLLGGLTAYFFTGWICLEPIWRQRIINSLAAIAGLYLFCIDSKAGAYTTFLPYLIGLLIVGFTFTFYSAARFKNGAQW